MQVQMQESMIQHMFTHPESFLSSVTRLKGYLKTVTLLYS
jgi:hypothetical protein